VIHLAGVTGIPQCEADPEYSAKVNVLGSRVLIDQCARLGKPVLFASSLSVIGPDPRTLVRENTPACPAHEYARQKAAVEETLRSCYSNTNSVGVSLRMSNVYGDYSVHGRRITKANAVTTLTHQAVNGGPLTVHSPGTQRRDFVHVRDVIEHWQSALEWALNSESGGVRYANFNVVSGEVESIFDVANLLGEIVRTESEGYIDPQVVVLPSPRSAVEFGWQHLRVSRADTQRILGVECTRKLGNSLRTDVRELLALHRSAGAWVATAPRAETVEDAPSVLATGEERVVGPGPELSERQLDVARTE